MKFLPGIFTAVVLLLSSAVNANEIAVLLPITGPMTPYEKSELSKELITGLSTKFELEYGEEVDRFVKQVFREESKKSDCDETNCYRRIASLYHAGKIVAFRVTEIDKGHFLVTAHLYDVPTGELVSTQKEECNQCSFEKLKSLCKEFTGRMIKVK